MKILEDHAVFARECALRAEYKPGLSICEPEDYALYFLVGFLRVVLAVSLRENTGYLMYLLSGNYYLNDKFAETITPKLLMDLHDWVEAFAKMKPKSCSRLRGHSDISGERNRETVCRLPVLCRTR